MYPGDMGLFPTTLIDFYKSGHVSMMPDNTTLLYSNFTPRSNKHFPVKGVSKIVWYGFNGILQWLVRDYWNEHFFKKPLAEVLEHYNRRMDNALGPGAVPTDHIKALHKLGYLPLKIKALPEGTLVPFGVPVFTIRNTHKDFAWLVGYFEDMLSCEVWPVVTSTTLSYEIRKVINRYATITGTPMAVADWQVHCFAFRGMRGIHDAAQSLSGHMLTSYGTDTVPVLDYIEKHYHGKDIFLGGSVPATEHMVMCMNIAREMRRMRKEGSTLSYDDLWLEAEYLVFKDLITKKYPSGIISIVSDTKNLWDVLTKIAPRLKSEILSRIKNALGFAKVVFRPDSGDPEKILCGTIRRVDSLSRDRNGRAFIQQWGDKADCLEYEGKFYMVLNNDFIEVTPTVEQKGAVWLLWETFGGTVTSEGYRMLDEHVGIIYGDSITTTRADSILCRLMEMGFASGCVFFGRGSYEAVYATRDSTGSALKATYGEVDGEELELFKDPITDDGTKRSARGLLRVEEENGTYVSYDQQTREQEASGALQTVFEDSVVTQSPTFVELRQKLGILSASA